MTKEAIKNEILEIVANDCCYFDDSTYALFNRYHHDYCIFCGLLPTTLRRDNGMDGELYTATMEDVDIVGLEGEALSRALFHKDGDEYLAKHYVAYLILKNPEYQDTIFAVLIDDYTAPQF